MATLMADNAGLNMNNLGFANYLSATVFDANATTALAVYADGSYQLFAGNFVHDGSGHLTGGTITGIVEFRSGTVPYSISGLSYPVTSFLAFLNVDDKAGLIADVFSGADSVLGGLGGDTLSGYAGKDTISGGGGNDSLNGGLGNDFLVGDEGNDTIDGGAGNDTMDGGKGDDTYLVDSFDDLAIEISGTGNDTVLASADYQLSVGIENLTLVGSALIGVGNELANVVTGNNLDNQLYALEGNDTIIGGGGKDTLVGAQGNDSLLGGEGADYLAGDFTAGNGNDTLDGGTGNDTIEGGKGDDLYIVDSSFDFAGESTGGGIDTVHAYADYFLSPGSQGIENLVLKGAAAYGEGNDLDNVIIGNDGDNFLDGNDGADTLDGGTGTDYLNGGFGDDIYLINDVSDYAYEFDGFNGGGIDTVKASVDYVLSSAAEGIENLALLGSATYGSGNGLDNVITGNEIANWLYGDAGSDTLDGGAGDDVMEGGEGDDLYIVDSAGDIAFENDEFIGGGVDTVKASVDYSFLATTNDIENLVLVGSAVLGEGNELDNAITGNEFDNTLFGDAGNDTLDGGNGSDTLTGGIGDDTYVVKTGSEVMIENEDEGLDTVQSSIDYQLSANLENLALLEGAATGKGNELNNVITGNDASNELFGFDGDDTLNGGLGSDVVRGGAGNDTYIVDNDNADKGIVEDEDGGVDTVQSYVGDCTLAANVENLTLNDFAELGIGNNLGNIIIGSDADNVLSGEGGDDTLDGGGGADGMTGGAGNDIYFIDNEWDFADEFDELGEEFGGGIDTVFSTADTTILGRNIENLVLLGQGWQQAGGNELANHITGSDSNDFLAGFDGNDTIDGGFDSDVMNGGLGDDLFLVDDESDYVYEDAEFDGGIDTVHSTAASFTLGSGIENLVLKDAAWFGGGNELDNVIVGTEFDNSLDGADGNDSLSGGTGNDELSGGSGADTLAGGADNDTLFGGTDADSMAGGAGDDFYTVDSKLDVITELSGGGTDTVQSSIDYTLANNFENLVLIDTAYRGVGNNLANTITGNDGVNNLDGGSGNDTIDGGAGNDTLYGSFGNDELHGGAGNDRIDCLYNQDRVMYTSVLDGHDLLTNFSTGGTGQDYVDLDGLFDSLGVAAADRAGRVSIVDNGGGADVCIDTDGVGGWDLNLASIQYVPDLSAITVGTDATSDVFVGS